MSTHSNPSTASSTLYSAPPGHLTLLMAARRTASFTLPSDPRFSFFAYIPRSHPVTRRARGEDVTDKDYAKPVAPPAPLSGINNPALAGGSSSPTTSTSVPRPPPPFRPPGPNGYHLLVVMHDSSRDAEKLRDNWAELAEETGCIILSPHFPCDFKFPDGPDNYKRLAWTTPQGDEVRYDEVLLEMIDTIGREWGCVDTRTFSLVGFSGGGQFVLRFFYLYPERIHAVSIGAPGRATPLIPGPWPEGIDGAPIRKDGKSIDPNKLAELTQSGATKVQLLIGELDTWHPVQPDGTRAPHSRFDVLQEVRKSFDKYGITYDYEVVAGAKHEGEKIREFSMPWVRENVN